MIDIFKVLIAIFLITGAGYAFIRLLKLWEEGDILSTVSISYGMGIGIIYFQLFLYSRMNITWNLLSLLFPWFFLFLILIIKNRKKLKSRLKFPKTKNFKRHEIILLFAIVITLLYTFFEAIVRPLSVWDGLAIWLFKSKVFFLSGGISTNIAYYPDTNHPLIISTLGTFVYIILGKINDSAVLITSVAFYFYTALLFFSVLKKKFGITYALLFTFLMVATQNYIRHGGRLEAGQADLPLGYFIFICIILFLEYLKTKNSKICFLLSLFLGITALTKQEGLFFSGIISICFLYNTYKENLYKDALIFFLWLVPVLDWEIYKKINNSSLFLYPFVFSFSKVTNAFMGMINEFFNIKSWNLLWIMYFFSLFAFDLKGKKEFLILNFVILSQLIFYFMLYCFVIVFTPQSSAERLFIHLAPLAYLFIALTAYPTYKNLLKIKVYKILKLDYRNFIFKRKK